MPMANNALLARMPIALTEVIRVPAALIVDMRVLLALSILPTCLVMVAGSTLTATMTLPTDFITKACTGATADIDLPTLLSNRPTDTADALRVWVMALFIDVDVDSAVRITLLTAFCTEVVVPTTALMTSI